MSCKCKAFILIKHFQFVNLKERWIRNNYIKTTRNCYLRDECYYQKYSDMAVFRIEEYRDQLLQKAKEILLAECPDKVFDECL